MRRVALLVALLAIGSQTVWAQSGHGLVGQRVDAGTRAELEKARDAVWRAWFAGDSAQLAQLIPGALAAGSRSGWEDRATSFAGARQFAQSGGTLAEIRFDSTTVTLKGDVAVMQALFTYVTESADGKRAKRRGTATEVFVRQGGRWVNPFWYLQ
jgi:hypothetical protein